MNLADNLRKHAHYLNEKTTSLEELLVHLYADKKISKPEQDTITNSSIHRSNYEKYCELYALIVRRELEESYLKDLFIKTKNDHIITKLWGIDAKEEHLQNIQKKTIYWVPLPKNEFYDRKHLLETIDSNIQRNDNDSGNEMIKVALIGPEGYGKDSVAIKYISEMSSNFKYIFWINAQSEDTLRKGYEKISKVLNGRGNNYLETLENLEETWLIVLSKASIITIGNYIPKKGGSILVTSTEGNWSSLGFSKINVESFENAITPENAEIVFPQIAKNLYVKGDFENAFKYYQKTKNLLDRQNPRNSVKYEKIIREVAHCALKNGKPAKAIENYRLALNLRNEANNNQNNQVSNKMIDGDEKSTAYYEYKIGECQRVNEDVVEAKDFYKKALASASNSALICKIYRGIGFCFEYQGKFEFALMYFNKAIELIKEDLFLDTKYEFKCAKLKLNIASCLFKQRMIPEALKLYKESCHIFEHLEGRKRNEIRLAEALAGIASCYNFKGEGNESLILYQESLSIIEKQCGKNHIKTVNIHNGIGLSYYYKRNIHASMSSYKKANEILECITNSRFQNEMNSNIFHGLGLCNLKLGHYDEGFLNFEKALNFKRARYNGEKNLEFTVTLNGMGWTCYQKRDLNQALGFFRKAEKISLVLGEVESVEYSDTLHGLGSILNYQGNIEKSKDYFDKSLKIKEKHFGANHGESAILLYNIGRYYYGKESKVIRDSDNLEGEKYCEMAFRIMSSKFDRIEGNLNFECASVLDGIAEFLQEKEKYIQAQKQFEKAKNIKEIHFGKDHLSVGHSLRSLGLLKHKHKLLKFGNAEKDYDEALRIFKIHLPANHGLIAELETLLTDCKGHVDIRKEKRSTSVSSIGSGSGSGTLIRKKEFTF